MSRRTSRGLSLTDKGRAAIGVAETVEVPLLTDAGTLARFRPPVPADGVPGGSSLGRGRFLRSGRVGGYDVGTPGMPIKETNRHE